MSSQEEPANLGFEDGEEPDGWPLRWRGGGEGYELGVDPDVARVSGSSGRVRCTGVPVREGFGTLTQCFAAAAYRGAVVRYSGFLKTADVRGRAGLWMRVDGDNGQTLRFDNMADPVDRPIVGSTDWARYEIVLDIPPEASEICLGFLLSGTGTVWGDDLEFGVLDGPISDEIHAEIRLRRPREEPVNLGFEDGSERDGRPVRWYGGGKGYELSVDPMVSYSPGSSGRVRCVGLRGPEDFGTLTQCFAAAAYRGAVVRYSGFLKTADVRGWAGLWMRVDGDNRQTLRFDNMATPVDRSIAGSTDWAQYEIVLDIPPEATAICLGFLLSGTGTVWGDDFEFGVLDPGRDRPARLPGRQTGQSAPVRSLPAGPSASGVEERGVPAGAGESGGEVLADDELFLGRIVEQEEFEKLLTELSRATKREERTWSRVVIVHGIGGIGKTTLAGRLHDIAGGAAYRDKYEVVCVDWAEVRTRDPAFGVRPGPSFEEVLDRLEHECSRSGRLARHFEQYRRLRLRIANVRAGVSRMVDQSGGSQSDTAVGRSARLVGSALQAGEVLGVPPGIGEATQAAGMTADALSALWKTGESWLRDRLDPGDYELLVRPLDVLASAFGKGLAKAASRRPVVLLLDTCEIVSPAGPWLRVLMREGGPRVAWLLFGRFEADPPGSPAELNPYSDPVPGGRLSELDAYRKAVPGDRLRLFELGAFDAGMLRAYLSRAAPQRPVDEAGVSRLLTATAGIPLAVRLAASMWERGMPVEMIADPVPISASRRTVVEGMTKRFLLHLSDDDREKIQALALVLDPDDAPLIAALWSEDRVSDTFDSLAERYDFVYAGQFRLHDTIHAFLLRYLLDPFHRAEAGPLNQRAVTFLEQRLQARQQNLPTLERRMADKRWVSDMLALVWHRFWVDDESGWATLLAVFPAAIAYSPGTGRALLDLASRLVPSTAHDEQRRLRLLRDTVGPMAALADQAGAESLSELDSDIRRSPVEPDEGCGGERAAILEWLNGQRALHNSDLPGAFDHLAAAAGLTAEPARRLRRWISRGLLDLSRQLPSDSPTARPDPDQAPYAIAASLAVELEPDNPGAQRQWGRILRHLGRNEEALSAFNAAIELDHLSADAHIERGEALRKMGRNDEALDALNRAIDLSPDDARAIVARGLTHLALKDHEKALTDFGKAIELDRHYGLAFHARAYADYSMGLYSQALADIDEAIALDPGDTGAVAFRNQIRLSMPLRGDTGRQWLQRFSPEARRIVVQASEEARLLGHDNIGTGHLLLGLIHENQGMVASALAPLTISLEEAHEQLREMTGPDRSARPRSDSIPLTPQAKNVLVCCFKEALQLGHDSISAGHILLALLSEEQDSARILANLGADLKKAHERLIQLLH